MVFDTQDLLDHHKLPVIAIDGPSASGKGSVAQLVAKHLGFHYLDSGALYALQRSFLQAPGLVADGRDMSTVIFPQAKLKVFLTARVEIRAQRRHKQLISKGISANIDILTKDLVDRDGLDTSRQTAPLIKTADAFLLDTSEMGIEQAVQTILTWYKLAQ